MGVLRALISASLEDAVLVMLTFFVFSLFRCAPSVVRFPRLRCPRKDWRDAAVESVVLSWRQHHFRQKGARWKRVLGAGLVVYLLACGVGCMIPYP